MFIYERQKSICCGMFVNTKSEEAMRERDLNEAD